MFIILEKYRFLASWLGLEPFSRFNKNYLFAIGFVILSFSLILMSLGYFVTNIHDLKKATDAIVTASGFLITFSVILHILVNRAQFTLLEDELQEIVKASTGLIHVSLVYSKTN